MHLGEGQFVDGYAAAHWMNIENVL